MRKVCAVSHNWLDLTLPHLHLQQALLPVQLLVPHLLPNATELVKHVFAACEKVKSTKILPEVTESGLMFNRLCR